MKFQYSKPKSDPQAPRLMSLTLKRYNLSGRYLSSEPPLLVHGLQHDINNANSSLISREKKSDNSQHSSSSMQEFQLSAIIWKHFYLSQKQHAIFRSRWYSPLSLVVLMHWSMYMSIYLPLNLRKWMTNGLLNVCFKVVLRMFLEPKLRLLFDRREMIFGSHDRPTCPNHTDNGIHSDNGYLDT